MSLNSCTHSNKQGREVQHNAVNTVHKILVHQILAEEGFVHACILLARLGSSGPAALCRNQTIVPHILYTRTP